MSAKEKELTHLNKEGQAAMVDVGHKNTTRRMARARAVIELPAEVLAQVSKGEIFGKKGAVIQTAVIAGTMGAKKTPDLIPLCHSIGLESCEFTSSWHDNLLHLECIAQTEGKTGVEMEALTGVSVAALTVYDMCKALSHDIVIREIVLMEKRGGKSDFTREA